MSDPAHANHCLLILLDGLADQAHPELGGLTPLAAAPTPNLDRLAAAGSCGMHHALAPGAALSSEAAHFAMMGYDLAEFPGRALFEALGQGLVPGPDEVVVMARLMSVERDGDALRIIKRKPAVPAEELETLCAPIASFGGPEGSLAFHPAKGAWGVLVMRGGLSDAVTDSDPLYEDRPLLAVRPWAEMADDLAARRTARLLNAYLLNAHLRLSDLPLNFSRQRMGRLPVNAVATQRAGRARAIEPMGRRWGLKVKSISSSGIYAGLFKYIGGKGQVVDYLDDPGRDLAAKLDLALEQLDGLDLIHVHSKAPDEAAHAKDPKAKRDAIAALDAGLGPFLKRLADRPDILVAVTGDHATPAAGPMIHSGQPSPLILHGPGCWRDRVEAFSEVDCAAGCLGLLRGRELMLTIINAMGRAKLWGLRDVPQDRPYYPAPGVEPLTLNNRK